MKGNLLIGIISLFLSAGLLFTSWDYAVESLNCTSQYGEHIMSDIFNKNQHIKKFKLDDIISIETKNEEGRTRKRRTYTYAVTYINTKTQKIRINTDFSKSFIEFYNNPKGELNLIKYPCKEFGFIFAMLLFGLFNIILFFKPVNIGFKNSNLAHKIEEDGLIGLFCKK